MTDERAELVARLRDPSAGSYTSQIIMSEAAAMLAEDGRALAAKAAMPGDIAKLIERLQKHAHELATFKETSWRAVLETLKDAALALAATSARADDCYAANLLIRDQQKEDFARAEAAEARLREAKGLLREPAVNPPIGRHGEPAPTASWHEALVPADWEHRRDAILASGPAHD